MEYRLKTVQPYFDDVRKRSKNFELRYNDRDYRIGDVLILEEYDNVRSMDWKLVTAY